MFKKKLHSISDNKSTVNGLELAEVSSRLAHTPDELRYTLENLEPDVGIVIITSGLAAKSADVLDEYRAKNRLPMITIIPDPEVHAS